MRDFSYEIFSRRSREIPCEDSLLALVCSLVFLLFHRKYPVFVSRRMTRDIHTDEGSQITLISSSTAVAMLVCASSKRFFSNNSGSELTALVSRLVVSFKRLIAKS
jgi:uncharacterized protein YlxP (DUF503 family)